MRITYHEEDDILNIELSKGEIVSLIRSLTLLQKTKPKLGFLMHYAFRTFPTIAQLEISFLKEIHQLL